jgi:hypothetical protein
MKGISTAAVAVAATITLSALLAQPAAAEPCVGFDDSPLSLQTLLNEVIMYNVLADPTMDDPTEHECEDNGALEAVLGGRQVSE